MDDSTGHRDGLNEDHAATHSKSGKRRVFSEQERRELAYRRLDEVLRKSSRPIGARQDS